MFIPITEAQMLFGSELIVTHAVSPASHGSEINPFPSLSTDQFRAVVSLSESSSPDRGRAASASNAPPPHPWDWSPSAVSRRWNDYLDEKYKYIGRLVFRGAPFASFGAVFYIYFIRPYTADDGGPPPRRNSRRAGRGTPPPGGLGEMFESLRNLGVKDVFDYMLAPRY